MRYVKGPTASLAARPGQGPGPQPGEKRDVLPDTYFDEDGRRLTVSQKPFDAEAEAVPVQVLVFVIPEGSDLLRAEADEMVASGLPRSVTPLAADAADVAAPLPSYDETTANVLQVVYGFSA